MKPDTTEARRLADELAADVASLLREGLPQEALRADAAQSAIRALADENERMREALGRIERWHGEFPATGETWENGLPVSYGFVHGTVGEREFMRTIAREALK